MKNKCFQNHIILILEKLINREPFAFNRFSDGELYILKNEELILDHKMVKVGSNKTKALYNKEDHKRFCPQKHGYYRERLLDAFVFESQNYFPGVSCRCCVGRDNFNFQLDLLKESNSSFDNLTWSNLFLNSNYSFFVNLIIPVLFEFNIVFICNENADLSSTPNLIKDFRVGYNAMINDYKKIELISKWISSNNIKNHLFLFSASTFSKFAIHQLFKDFPNNTYLDIGTTLNPFIGMRSDRTYLRQYWLDERGSDLQKSCIW